MNEKYEAASEWLHGPWPRRQLGQEGEMPPRHREVHVLPAALSAADCAEVPPCTRALKPF